MNGVRAGRDCKGTFGDLCVGKEYWVETTHTHFRSTYLLIVSSIVCSRWQLSNMQQLASR